MALWRALINWSRCLASRGPASSAAEWTPLDTCISMWRTAVIHKWYIVHLGYFEWQVTFHVECAFYSDGCPENCETFKSRRMVVWLALALCSCTKKVPPQKAVKWQCWWCRVQGGKRAANPLKQLPSGHLSNFKHTNIKVPIMQWADSPKRCSHIIAEVC